MLSLRNLLRRKTRTLLTVTGVAVGVSIVVCMTAISRGFRMQVNGMFAAGQAHLILSRKDVADPILSYLPMSLPADLRGRPDVADVQPVLFAAQQIPPLVVFIYFGTTPESPFLTQVKITEGEGLFDHPGEDRLIMGRSAARRFGLELGGEFKIGKRTFRLVGLFESATPLIDSAAIMPLAAAQEAAGLEDKLTIALVTLNDPTRESLVASELSIEEAHPDVQATVPGEWASAFDEFDLADQAATVFSLLAICIGGISVMNTILMSVFERTREIGILRAVGWSKAMILREVIAESLLVALVGGPAGILLGVGVVEFIGTLDNFSWVAGDYGPRVFGEALVVAVGMGVVGATYPAWRAVNITPIEALRYE